MIKQDFGILSDGELWKEVTQGNQSAFAFLYEKYASSLFSYGFKFTQEKSFVEDVIQDVYVRLWEKREKLNINYSIKFYLFTSFRREILERLKDHRGLVQNTEDLESAAPLEDSFQDVLIREQIDIESQKQLKQALKILTSRQREVVYLKYLEGLSYDEIAALMDVKVPYLYNLVLKSLKSLKDYFVENGLGRLPVILLLPYIFE